MHLRGVVTHAQAEVQVMVAVVLLGRLRVVVVAARVVVVILLIGLALRVLLVLHAPVLEPYLDLQQYMILYIRSSASNKLY